jgi:3-hydroxyisobutyrate dehydrogenase-like beta-hydroxyacid dehydrogenase
MLAIRSTGGRTDRPEHEDVSDRRASVRSPDGPARPLLGNMGGNMAARYLAAGCTVYGEDPDRAAAQWLVDQGLRWADTPREVAEAADVVLTSLRDDIVELVSSGPDGIVAGLSKGKLWADLSTISPRTSRELSQRVREQGRGAQMLDAPVSGSVPQVKSGTLTIMVGGDQDAYARIEPVLRVLGTPTRIGENGQGLVLKLRVPLMLDPPLRRGSTSD